MSLFSRVSRRVSRLWRKPPHPIRSLEINVTAHCNLKCYGCGRGSPALDEEYLSAEDLRRDLAALRGVIEVGEFKLAGGEPLLHPELLTIIDIVRASGITRKITLITNGLLLHQYDAELWRRIDEIWVSAYPGVKRVFKHEDVLEQARRWQVVVEYNQMNTFTYRLLNQPNTDAEMVQDIFDHCYQRSGCHSLYNGRLYQCASGPFIPKWLEQVSREQALEAGEVFAGDGVAIHAGNDLYGQLADYYRRTQPLAACRHCLGGVGASFPNRQLTQAGVREWAGEQHADPHDYIDAVRLEQIRGQSADVNYDDYGRRIDLNESGR